VHRISTPNENSETSEFLPKPRISSAPVPSSLQVLILGCGYLGIRVARNLLQSGTTVHVLTRSADRARTLAAAGFRPHVGDVMEPSSLEELPQVDSVLHCIGFDRSGTWKKRDVYVEGLRNALEAMGRKSARWVHVSSTSVYGQDDGSVVDEASVTAPAAEGGQICLEAEAALAAFRERTGIATSVLRLAGIYGPGRLLAKAEVLRRGEALSGSGQEWLNLIHVEDAATIAVTVLGRDHPPEGLLVCDDEPVERRRYYTALAQLAAAPAPTFSEAASGTRNKRCSNRRLRSFGFSLSFPTIETGLPQAWRESERADPA